MKRIASKGKSLLVICLVLFLLLPGNNVSAGVVSPDGWEWMNPLPQGSWLVDIWGTSTNNIYAVGDAGTILHYDGISWSGINSGISYYLYGICGSSPTDVFAVGDGGTILHYDGMSWSTMSSGTSNLLESIWGSSPTDVFAVGDGGTILHYDGMSWSTMSSCTGHRLESIWGSSPTDVFAVGDYNIILHYDGISWSTMSSGSPSNLHDIWGNSPTDVFAVGENGNIYHYDGMSWSTIEVGPYSVDGVWGSSPTDVFAVGEVGVILRYDGISWSPMSSIVTSRFLRDAWGSSPSDVFVVEKANILHYDGISWSFIGYVGCYLEGVWGTSPTNVIAVGYSGYGIYHYDGISWSPMVSHKDYSLLDVWGSSSNDVFAVGWDGLIVHYDGTSWNPMNSGIPSRLWGVWGTSSTDVFAVGSYGIILHYNGVSWSPMNSGTSCDLTRVWASSPTDVFAVGYDGIILHYDGTSWSPMDSGTPNRLMGVWGSSSTNLFAVGQYGTIIHYDGISWSPMNSGTSEFLWNVWGLSSTDIFVIGNEGTILRYEPPYNTPVGTDVIVDLPYGDTGEPSPVTANFSIVTTAGDTTVTTSSTGPLVTPQFMLGEPPTYFDINTTATYEGIIKVCIDYSDIAFTFDKPENELRLLHETVAGLEDITIFPIDTDNNIICGETTSLSVFTIVQPNYPPVADPGGPYIADESNTITLDASGSADPDDSITLYEWDLDNDSEYDDASGITTDVTFDDNGTYIVGLRVTDELGEIGTDTTDVTVNNVAPIIESLTLPEVPIDINESILLEAVFSDPGQVDTHEATIDWGDGVIDEMTSVSSPIIGDHNYGNPGVYTVILTVMDDDGGVDTQSFQYVVVYDPEGGFVTGGGWIESPAGAYTADPALEGKASFGFVSKYKKGATTPTGNTQFQFKAGDMNFHSDSYDWLVIAHHKAMYKGVGTVNGQGTYGFMISAIDEALTPSTNVDLFRIKIWDKDNGDVIVYDNKMGADDDADPSTALGGGNIVIHKK